MINESMIRSFLVLAREGSYVRAARALYLSHQAVSKQMARLEEDLECALFRREQGRMTLTEAGKIYYDAFSRMDGIFSEARQLAGQQEDSWGNQLAIGVLDAMDLTPLTRELNKRFREAYPEVKITYRSNTIGLMEWLTEETVDVAFSIDGDFEAVDGVEVLPLKTLREYMLVSADHPLAKDGASYRDFRGEPVFYTKDQQRDWEAQKKRIKPEDFPEDNMVETDSFVASSVAVEHMQGVIFLMEGSRLQDNSNFRAYPTGRTSTVVLAYRAAPRKRCVRNYINAARKMFSAKT